MAEVAQEIDWDSLSKAQLDAMERKIAAKYMARFPLGIVLWGFTNTAIWLALWPLVLTGIMPLWLAFPIALFNVTAAYLPSHDAQHSIVAREGHKLRWLNELLGHVSLIPFAAPFRYLRHTHFEHHAHANDPALDPDYDVHADSRRQFFRQALSRMQPGDAEGQQAYPAALKRIGKEHLVLEALAVRAVYLLVLFGMAWTGHAIEAALLWWVPILLSQVYVRYYLSWKPHHPGKDTGRYQDTLAFRSRLGNLGSSGMQYHIVHHLYPRIPLMQTPAAYRELRPILERQGCDLGNL